VLVGLRFPLFVRHGCHGCRGCCGMLWRQWETKIQLAKTRKPLIILGGASHMWCGQLAAAKDTNIRVRRQKDTDTGWLSVASGTCRLSVIQQLYFAHPVQLGYPAQPHSLKRRTSCRICIFICAIQIQIHSHAHTHTHTHTRNKASVAIWLQFNYFRLECDCVTHTFVSMSAVIHPFICSIKSGRGAKSWSILRHRIRALYAACSCIDTRSHILTHPSICTRFCI